MKKNKVEKPNLNSVDCIPFVIIDTVSPVPAATDDKYSRSQEVITLKIFFLVKPSVIVNFIVPEVGGTYRILGVDFRASMGIVVRSLILSEASPTCVFRNARNSDSSIDPPEDLKKN